MGTFISKVEDVFEIAGRGCIVLPGIPKTSPHLKIKVGDLIILKTPDGSESETLVRGIEMGGLLQASFIPILLGSEITKATLPIGTALWTK